VVLVGVGSGQGCLARTLWSSGLIYSHPTRERGVAAGRAFDQNLCSKSEKLSHLTRLSCETEMH